MTTQMLGVRLTEREEEEIRKLVEAGLYVSVSEFIREAVRKHLGSLKIIERRKISSRQAQKEIIMYLKKHREAYASDIAEALGIDLDVVFEAMKKLSKEGVVE